MESRLAGSFLTFGGFFVVANCSRYSHQLTTDVSCKISFHWPNVVNKRFESAPSASTIFPCLTPQSGSDGAAHWCRRPVGLANPFGFELVHRWSSILLLACNVLLPSRAGCLECLPLRQRFQKPHGRTQARCNNLIIAHHHPPAHDGRDGPAFGFHAVKRGPLGF
jgi:hypothetical protein